MREIKFRFWLGHTKKMTYSLELKHIGMIIPEFMEGIVPLQYTGLKDKNGKEIYEGDIVKRTARKFDFEKADGEEMYYEEEISFIEYRLNGFWVKAEGFGWEGENLWNWDEMEVIGNIYESPHLLNNEPKPDECDATGDAILMNDDNKLNPVKEVERLYSKEDAIGFAEYANNENYSYLGEGIWEGDCEHLISSKDLFNEYLSSPEFKNNKK